MTNLNRSLHPHGPDFRSRCDLMEGKRVEIKDESRSARESATAVPSTHTTDGAETASWNNVNDEQQPQSKDSSSHRTGRWTLDEKLLFLYCLQKFGKGRWKKMSAYLPNRSLIQIKSHAQKVLKRMDAGEDVFHRLEENPSRLDELVAKVHETLGIQEVTLLRVVQRNRRGQSQSSRRRAVTTAAAAAALKKKQKEQQQLKQQQQQQRQQPQPAVLNSVAVVAPLVQPGTLFEPSPPPPPPVPLSPSPPAVVKPLSSAMSTADCEHIVAASALCLLSAPAKRGLLEDRFGAAVIGS